MKTALIGVSAMSLIVIALLSFQLLKKDKPKFAEETLTGDWKEIDGYARLSIKADNTFKFSLGYRNELVGCG